MALKDKSCCYEGACKRVEVLVCSQLRAWHDRVSLASILVDRYRVVRIKIRQLITHSLT